MRLIGPAVVGSRRWNKEWASLAIDLAQDRRTRLAAVRDAVHAMDANSAHAGWMSSQVQVSTRFRQGPSYLVSCERDYF